MADIIDLSTIPKNLNMPLSDNLRKAIAIAISKGYADSVPDFTRKAIASKLEDLGIFKKL